MNQPPSIFSTCRSPKSWPIWHGAAIDIDTTQIEPTAKESARFSVTMNLHGVPFRHVLGHLLYEAGCRCELEGQTLVILPPESKAESEKCTY